MLIAVDYASVDANTQPNFEEFKSACVDAGSRAAVCIFRGAYGMSPDPTIGRDWRRAADAGLTCGAYLFLRTKANLIPEDQVNVLADTIGALRPTDLVPVLDVEDTGLPEQQEFDYVYRAWAECVKIYGVPPIIYTSDRVWREDLGNMPAGEMADSPLWVAKPWPWQVHSRAQLSDTPFQTGRWQPPVPKPWGAGNWWLHQYQGDAYPAPGFSNTVDLSRFNMMVVGDSGPRVEWVQRRLGMAVTGVYDGAMAGRVLEFQKNSKLVADAVIGPKTFAAICWCRGVERPTCADA